MPHRQLPGDAMTLDDLTDECWAALPPLRKRLVGREMVQQMLEDSIAEWDTEAITACQGPADLDAYGAALVDRVKARRQQEYGFVLMSILLTAVLIAVVQWLVKWWLDRNFNRVMLVGWQREMTS